MEKVHQLVAQRGTPSGPAVRAPYSVVGRCGATMRRGDSNDPMPAGFSAWRSDVTCEDCLTGIPGPAALNAWT